MEDFEKRESPGDSSRFLIAMVLILALMGVWMWWTRSQTPPPDADKDKNAQTKGDGKTDSKADPKAEPKTGEPGKTEKSDKPGEKKAFAVAKPKGDPPAPAALGAGKTEDGMLAADVFRYRAEFRSASGSLSELRLTEFMDRLRATIDYTDRYPRPLPLLNPAGKEGDKFESFRVVRLVIDDKEVDLGDKDWALIAPTAGAENTIVFRLTVADAAGNDVVRIDKVFTVVPRAKSADFPDDGPGFMFTVAFKVESVGGVKRKVSFDFLGPLGVPEDHTQDIPKVVWGRRHESGRDTKEMSLGYDELIKKHGNKEALPKIAEKADAAGAIWYVGVSNRFFAAVVVPDRLRDSAKGKTPAETELESIDLRHFDQPVEPISEKTPSHAFAPVFRVSREAAGEWTAAYNVYVGPKKDSLFREVGAHLGADLYLEKIIAYASGCCFMDSCSGPIGTFIGYPMLWLLEKIADILPGHNYGVAVIILVLIVRFLVYPISRKSTMSMLRMKELQPKIAELQAKFAGKKEELSKHQMELYSKEGVNPLGGCLPMMLQMPIWIGLWGALSAATNLRHQPFFLWIKDLAGDDALIRFAGKVVVPLGCFDLPLPNVLNVLPLVMVVVMYIQQKAMQPAQASPDQPNPKIMMAMMSGMFLFMLYAAPSGLNLYIMTSTLAGFVEQWWVKRQYEDLKARGLLAPKDAKPGFFGRLIERVRNIQEEQERLKSGKGGDRPGGGKKKK